MRQIATVALVGLSTLLAWTSPAVSATPSAAQQAQQDRMKSCNVAASDRSLKGSQRQTFMSLCLGGKSDPNTMMKICNAQASQDKLAAAARSTYLSSCLKSPN